MGRRQITDCRFSRKQRECLDDETLLLTYCATRSVAKGYTWIGRVVEGTETDSGPCLPAVEFSFCYRLNGLPVPR